MVVIHFIFACMSSSPACPILHHADGDVVTAQYAGECRASELQALFRVDDFRPAVTRGYYILRENNVAHEPKLWPV